MKDVRRSRSPVPALPSLVETDGQQRPHGLWWTPEGGTRRCTWSQPARAAVAEAQSGRCGISHVGHAAATRREVEREQG